MYEPFTPTRAAGLAALEAFIPEAGRRYAQSRNHDLGPGARSNVSMLSPYLRHRLITEQEVVGAVLEMHSAASAEKFVQEVFWRTYWKGWLELRPAVWRRYRGDVASLLDERDTADWSDDLAAALAGNTGIDCFDAWIDELATEGYLHNHARMWFASIWIFTLRLPWQLGADLFYRQLIDGDAASNTLSWRWVAGLQTSGKTYLATAHNIATYTEGRFSPHGLATHATALSEEPIHESITLGNVQSPPSGRAGLLVHEDDLHLESLHFPGVEIACVSGVSAVGARSPLPVSPLVEDFTRMAVGDGMTRAAEHSASSSQPLAIETLPGFTADAVEQWASAHDLSTVVAAYAPVGPAQEIMLAMAGQLAGRGITVATARRDWDTLAWPYARRGFFPFRERIPQLLAQQRVGARN